MFQGYFRGFRDFQGVGGSEPLNTVKVSCEVMTQQQMTEDE